jgi:hypothetical protein
MGYDSAALADAVDHAAAMLTQAAAEVHVIDQPYSALPGVNLMGRLAVLLCHLPWLRINAVLASLLAVLAAASYVHRDRLISRFDDFVTAKVCEEDAGLLNPTP